MTDATIIASLLLVLALGAGAAIRIRSVRRRRPPRRPAPAARSRARCPTGKVIFTRQADADRVVRRSQSGPRPGYDRPLVRSYRCPRCGFWHTTSQQKRITW
jgi:uncharacterized C2H2 Zn-finger protein